MFKGGEHMLWQFSDMTGAGCPCVHAGPTAGWLGRMEVSAVRGAHGGKQMSECHTPSAAVAPKSNPSRAQKVADPPDRSIEIHRVCSRAVCSTLLPSGLSGGRHIVCVAEPPHSGSYVDADSCYFSAADQLKNIRSLQVKDDVSTTSWWVVEAPGLAISISPLCCLSCLNASELLLPLPSFGTT